MPLASSLKDRVVSLARFSGASGGHALPFHQWLNTEFERLEEPG